MYALDAWLITTLRAAADDMSKCSTFCKMFNILKFHKYIWNNRVKCIQISTNIPGFCSLFREIDVNIQEFEKAKVILLSKTNARVLFHVLKYQQDQTHSFPTFTHEALLLSSLNTQHKIPYTNYTARMGFYRHVMYVIFLFYYNGCIEE